LLAIEYRRGGLERYAGIAKSAALAATVVLFGLTAFYGELDYMDAGTAMFGSIAIMVLGASALVIATSTSDSRLSGLLRSRFLRFFGRYSYAIYIVHTAVLAGLNHYRPFALLPTVGGFALPAQTIWAVAYVGVSTGVAMLSWHLVEKHFLRLKRFFPYRPKPNSGEAVT
ncbi:MAG TPA: acyltransferase family protein, partial [Gemmatimonadaceae bacterium]